MRKELRWKDKAGEFLPENGRESERDMRVEVVHYSDMESQALDLIANLEEHGLTRNHAFCYAEGRLVQVALLDTVKLPFGLALEMAKNGYSIQREGWNGKDMLVRTQFPDAHSKMTLPYLYIEYPDGRRCPWLASQTDLMAEDWRVL